MLSSGYNNTVTNKTIEVIMPSLEMLNEWRDGKGCANYCPAKSDFLQSLEVGDVIYYGGYTDRSRYSNSQFPYRMAVICEITTKHIKTDAGINYFLSGVHAGRSTKMVECTLDGETTATKVRLFIYSPEEMEKAYLQACTNYCLQQKVEELNELRKEVLNLKVGENDELVVALLRVIKDYKA